MQRLGVLAFCIWSILALGAPARAQQAMIDSYKKGR